MEKREKELQRIGQESFCLGAYTTVILEMEFFQLCLAKMKLGGGPWGGQNMKMFLEMDLGNCSSFFPFPYPPILHTNVKGIYQKHEFINAFFAFGIVSAARARTMFVCIPSTAAQGLARDGGSIKACGMNVCMHVEMFSVVNYRDQFPS